jgi:lipopolysaccharide/colanic/teichoic acid biosynthesis glycosyltransferase
LGAELQADRRWSSSQRVLELALIVAVSPLVVLLAAVIAVAVWLDSPGAVIFRAPRVGREGRMFEMLKFRKMRQDACGAPLTAAHDDRYTPIGRFLANTRLDELPQIWNVLRGEMCLVGPRPEVASFVSEFADQYAEITRVTPGMTGPAQLRFVHEKSFLGSEDPVTTYRAEILPQKILIDLEYARNRTPAGDLRILGQTALLPLWMLGRWLERQSGMVRSCLPLGVLAGILLVLFLMSSGNVA